MSEITEKRIDPMLAAIYGDELNAVAEEVVVEEAVVEETEAVAEIVTEPVIEVKEPEIVVEVEKPIAPAFEFADESSRWLYDKLSKGEIKEAYQALKEKYEYEHFSDEQKVIKYLELKNPHMDAEDIAFTAATEYGIGVDAMEDEEFLSAEQKSELRKQAIKRKGLLGEAQGYFDEKSQLAQLPTLANPLDTDEGYISYKESIVAKEAQELQSKQKLEQIYKTVDTETSALNSITLENKIPLDEGEFDFKSEFKLDDAKKKELAQHVKDYTPTQAEIQASTIDGEFDMKGYIQIQAEKLFHKQIQHSAIKEALSQRMNTFLEKELYNSTLRNNDTMVATTVDVPMEVQAMQYGRNR